MRGTIEKIASLASAGKKNQDKILISAPAREKTGRSGARTSDAATQSHRSNQAFLNIIKFS